jgi:hypothetical protein
MIETHIVRNLGPRFGLNRNIQLIKNSELAAKSYPQTSAKDNRNAIPERERNYRKKIMVFNSEKR